MLAREYGEISQGVALFAGVVVCSSMRIYGEKREREKRKERKRAGWEEGAKDTRVIFGKDGTWEQSINSTAWRVSYPCYSSHKDTTRHSALPRDQIILYWKMCKYSSLAGRVPAFWQLPSYRRALLFSTPYSFGYEAIFNTRQFYNDENQKVQWSSILTYFVLSKPAFPCVNKNSKTEFQCNNYFYRKEMAFSLCLASGC